MWFQVTGSIMYIINSGQSCVKFTYVGYVSIYVKKVNNEAILATVIVFSFYKQK